MVEKTQFTLQIIADLAIWEQLDYFFMDQDVKWV